MSLRVRDTDIVMVHYSHCVLAMLTLTWYAMVCVVRTLSMCKCFLWIDRSFVFNAQSTAKVISGRFLWRGVVLDYVGEGQGGMITEEYVRVVFGQSTAKVISGRFLWRGVVLDYVGEGQGGMITEE